LRGAKQSSAHYGEGNRAIRWKAVFVHRKIPRFLTSDKQTGGYVIHIVASAPAGIRPSASKGPNRSIRYIRPRPQRPDRDG
jgi:hypothetical protein